MIGWSLLLRAALAQSPVTEPPETLVLPQPWAVSQRRKPFTWVAPTDTRQRWSESRLTTDFRGPEPLFYRRQRIPPREDALHRAASDGTLDLAVTEQGTRWVLSPSLRSVRVGLPPGVEADRSAFVYQRWPVRWSVAEDGDVQAEASSVPVAGDAPQAVWTLVTEPFSHVLLAPPGGPVVPGATWDEAPVSDTILRSDELGPMPLDWRASGRFEGWVQREGTWLALLSFAVRLELGPPLEADVTTTSHVLVDPATGLPVWAASLSEWTAVGREPWSELVIRERDDGGASAPEPGGLR